MRQWPVPFDVNAVVLRPEMWVEYMTKSAARLSTLIVSGWQLSEFRFRFQATLTM